jgi:multiple sugar transport system ATP-binding protein
VAGVTLENVRKAYGDNLVVKQFDLEIADGEFVVLLGGSGCGKSTVLRMIAGLETITDGTIRIGDRVVNDLDPGERDLAFVFQNYALYPHMNVRQNMAFCLENLRLPRAEIVQRVDDAARIVHMDELLDRLPGQLSGGQRQRVAIGRAIVRRSKVLLMDEPLSNLDAKLRGEMRAEIARIQDDLGITTVYVTHDQVEAMTMADRIVILHDGLIQQIGRPMDVFRAPINRFVAGFIGSPSMNFLPVDVQAAGDGLQLQGESVTVPLAERQAHRLEGYAGRRLVLGFRPQAVLAADADTATVSGTVRLIEPFGTETYIQLDLGGATVSARLDPADEPVRGEPFHLAIEPEDLYFFDPDTDAAIV